MRTLHFLATVVVSCSAAAQGNAEIAVQSIEAAAPAYPTISYATIGPSYGYSDGAIRGQFHRVLFVDSGLAYDAPRIRLESLTYGDEGCCAQVVAAWELKLADLQSKGVRLSNSGTTKVVFVKWRSPRAFDLKVGNFTCSIAGVGQSKVKVACAD